MYRWSVYPVSVKYISCIGEVCIVYRWSVDRVSVKCISCVIEPCWLCFSGKADQTEDEAAQGQIGAETVCPCRRKTIIYCSPFSLVNTIYLIMLVFAPSWSKIQFGLRTTVLPNIVDGSDPWGIFDAVTAKGPSRNLLLGKLDRPCREMIGVERGIAWPPQWDHTGWRLWVGEATRYQDYPPNWYRIHKHRIMQYYSWYCNVLCSNYCGCYWGKYTA